MPTVTELLMQTIKPKFLEVCAIKLNLHNGTEQTVVGCYHPPLATAEASALL